MAKATQKAEETKCDFCGEAVATLRVRAKWGTRTPFFRTFLACEDCEGTARRETTFIAVEAMNPEGLHG